MCCGGLCWCARCNCVPHGHASAAAHLSAGVCMHTGPTAWKLHSCSSHRQKDGGLHRRAQAIISSSTSSSHQLCAQQSCAGASATDTQQQAAWCCQAQQRRRAFYSCRNSKLANLTLCCAARNAVLCCVAGWASRWSTSPASWCAWTARSTLTLHSHHPSVAAALAASRGRAWRKCLQLASWVVGWVDAGLTG